VGARADVCVLDADLNLTQVIVEGDSIDLTDV
jgi:N-acetylglucosamine-6-phosphate deacetylase